MQSGQNLKLTKSNRIGNTNTESVLSVKVQRVRLNSRFLYHAAGAPHRKQLTRQDTLHNLFSLHTGDTLKASEKLCPKTFEVPISVCDHNNANLGFPF